MKTGQTKEEIMFNRILRITLVVVIVPVLFVVTKLLVGKFSERVHKSTTIEFREIK